MVAKAADNARPADFLVDIASAPPGCLQQILSAQEQAEAAQKALMSAGELGEAAAGNELLRSMLETWSTVQRLYHKALKPFLEQHAEYAGSPAGG